jgi:hypothetical protein
VIPVTEDTPKPLSMDELVTKAGLIAGNPDLDPELHSAWYESWMNRLRGFLPPELLSTLKVERVAAPSKAWFGSGEFMFTIEHDEIEIRFCYSPIFTEAGGIITSLVMMSVESKESFDFSHSSVSSVNYTEDQWGEMLTKAIALAIAHKRRNKQETEQEEANFQAWRERFHQSIKNRSPLPQDEV